MSIAFFIYLTLFFIGLSAYYKHKPANVLVCLFALGTGCFKVLSVDDSLLHPYDFMILLTIFITVSEYSRTRAYFKCKNDPIGKIILVVLIYTTLVMIGSVLLGQELLSFALKTYRVNLMFLIYFYFRKQRWSTAKRFFDIMLLLSIFQGILFYLQLAGIELLQGGGVMKMTDFIRYKGFPSLSVFFVLLAMLDENMNIGKRIFLLLFFGGMMLLSMNRGPILTVIIAYGTYIIVHRRVKNLVYLGIFSVFFVLVVAPVIEKRNNEKSTASEDLKTMLANPLATHESFTAGSGTMLYRFSCVTERINYLLENPQYIPFGIGTVHENSPQNNYNLFITGLRNSDLRHGKETISSDDVTWVNIIMCYGAVGLILFVMIYIIGAKVALPQLKKTDDAIFMVVGALPLAYLFASTGTNHFNFAIRLLEFLLPFIMIRMYSNRSIAS